MATCIRGRKTQAAAAPRLDLVHRDIGLFEQFRRHLQSTAKHRGANAVALVFMALQLVRLGQAGQDFSPMRCDSCAASSVRVDKSLSMTTNSSPPSWATVGHARRHAGAAPPGSAVRPHFVAQRVIERLELVQIRNSRAPAGPNVAPAPRLAQAVEQQAPVGQAGQRVVKARFSISAVARRKSVTSW